MAPPVFKAGCARGSRAGGFDFPSALSVRASRRSDPLNGSSGDGSLPLVGAPYVVRWPLTAKTLVPAMLGTALLVGWLALWPGIGGHRPPAIFWAFLVLVLVLRAGRIRNGRIAFEVGPAGIRMSEPVTLYGGRLVAVPWRSIAEVVVLPPRVSSPADLGTSVGAVGVRLRPTSPATARRQRPTWSASGRPSTAPAASSEVPSRTRSAGWPPSWGCSGSRESASC